MFKRQTSMAITLLAVALLTMSYAQLQGQNAKPKAPAVFTAGVVDLNKLLPGLDEQSAIKASITVMQEKMRREEQDKKEELQALQADLKVSKPNSPNYNKLLEKLQLKAMEYEVWGKFAQQKLAREQIIRTQAIYRKLTEAVAAVAKRRNFSVVLQKDGIKDFSKPLQVKSNQQLLLLMGGHKVLFANDAIDITDEVTQSMNNAFNNAPKK